MREIIKYELIHDYPESIAELINMRLKEGWELYGPTFARGTSLVAQAMVNMMLSDLGWQFITCSVVLFGLGAYLGIWKDQTDIAMLCFIVALVALVTSRNV